MKPISAPFGITVTVLRRPTRDRTGDPQGADASHAIDLCAVDWSSGSSGSASASEVNDRRETSVSQVTLYVPRSADILATDHVEMPNGDVYRVSGKPSWDEEHPMTGWNTGYKVVRLEGVF